MIDGTMTFAVIWVRFYCRIYIFNSKLTRFLYWFSTW